MNHLESKIREIIGDFNPAASPPPVAPLGNDSLRPRWSVMIPTFNCAHYLKQTLESVLAQDPGAEFMQIEVVDDCSTKDDPEQVVKDIGKGRVSFYRREKNGGATANFNTCIERSCGEIVHILHGDDWVLPGFYQEVESALVAHPDAGMAVVRTHVSNESGQLVGLAASAADQVGPHYVFPRHTMSNDFYTPGLVFRRSAFELLGGFRSDLVHVADWEITVRVYLALGAVYVSNPLACYRFFPGNDTGRLALEAKNIVDYLRYALIVQQNYANFDLRQFTINSASAARSQAINFIKKGNRNGFRANDTLASRLEDALGMKVSQLRRVKRMLKYTALHLASFLKK